MKKTDLDKTKKDLADRVSAEAGITKREAAIAVNAVFEEIMDVMKAGGSCTITGFGKFEVQDRDSRMCYNPIKGEMAEVPAKRTPKFKASDTFRAALQKSLDDAMEELMF